MGIKQEIVLRFFEELEKINKFPNSTKSTLKELWETDQLASKEKIKEAIKRGVDNGDQD